MKVVGKEGGMRRRMGWWGGGGGAKEVERKGRDRETKGGWEGKVGDGGKE